MCIFMIASPAFHVKRPNELSNKILLLSLKPVPYFVPEYSPLCDFDGWLLHSRRPPNLDRWGLIFWSFSRHRRGYQGFWISKPPPSCKVQLFEHLCFVFGDTSYRHKPALICWFTFFQAEYTNFIPHRINDHRKLFGVFLICWHRIINISWGRRGWHIRMRVQPANNLFL